MKAWVVDASVAAKWVLPSAGEELVPEAVHLLDLSALGQTELMVPDLFWAECGSVLWRAVRTGRCTTAVGESGLATLKAHNLTTVATAALVEEAFSIAIKHQCSVYDSLYVALAVELGVQLVTADQRLSNALARRFPVTWLGAL